MVTQEPLEQVEVLGHLEPAYEYQRTLKDYLGALRRRFWLALTVGLVILAAGLVAAFSMPPVYRSAGTILIEQQLIPQDLVRTTVTSFATERIQVIGQRVMTTSNLLKVIDKYDVYPEDQQEMPSELLVENMRSNIDVDMISANVRNERTGQTGAATIAFKVGFQHAHPDVAQKVADELVTLYLNENLRTRTELAMETTTFLADESRRLAQKVVRLEQSIAEFKKRHEGRLPEQQALNRSLYERTGDELQATLRRIDTLQQSRQMVLQRLANVEPFETLERANSNVLTTEERLRQLRNTYVSLRAEFQSGHPDLERTRRELDSVIKEVLAGNNLPALKLSLVQVEEELAAIPPSRSDDHPEVARLTTTMAALRKRIDGIVNRDVSEFEGIPGATNPAYVQLQSQLAAIELELAAEQEEKVKLKERLAQFETWLRQAPEVEGEFKRLMRDYRRAISDHREIREKETEARLAQALESERKGERFTLIEPPLRPGQPVSPNRPAIAGLGALLAIAGALGVVFLAEFADQSIRSARRVAAILGEAPLSAIPPIVLPEERRRRRRRRILVGAGAVTGMVVVGVTLVHFFYRPLDLVWFQLLRAAGLMA